MITHDKETGDWHANYDNSEAIHAFLTLTALNIALTHDLRPKTGPNANSTAIEAHFGVALELLRTAMGQKSSE